MADAKGRVHSVFKVKANGRKRLVVFDTQDLSLGRAAENDLALDDPEMSRKHAVFRRTREGCRVEDQGTSNGTGVNGESVDHAVLRHGDVVRIGEIEITYAETTRNPATLGSAVEYASQLKTFASPLAGDSGDGEATILGIGGELPGDDEPFEVGPARDFDFGLHEDASGANAPRDLDAELENLGADLIADPSEPDDAPTGQGVGPAAEAWTLDEEPEAPAAKPAPAASASASGTLSLTLEIDGLDAASRAKLEAWVGKTLELAGLRVRVKGRDLG